MERSLASLRSLAAICVIMTTCSMSNTFLEVALAQNFTPGPKTSDGWDYKPRNLEDAHNRLEQLLSAEELARIDSARSESEIIQLHAELGPTIRNQWELWNGSGPLRSEMNRLGFIHPDDISAVIINTFWCKRHGRDFELARRRKEYKSYWENHSGPPQISNESGPITWKGGVSISDSSQVMIYYGVDPRGNVVAYRKDKGFFAPDAELRKRFHLGL